MKQRTERIVALVCVVLAFFIGYYTGRRSKAPQQVAQRTPMATSPTIPLPAVKQTAAAPVVKVIVGHGDTFSDLVHDLYGDGTRPAYEAAAKVTKGLTAPNDPDMLEVGQLLTFPCTIAVNGETLRGSLKEASRRWAARHTDDDDPAILDPEISRPIFADDPPPILIEAPPAIQRADDPPSFFDVGSPLLLPPPEPDPPSYAMNTSKKVAGYRMVIPKEAAAGIPLKKDLETCVVFSNDQDCSFTSRAEPKHGNVVLSTSLREIPRRPFKLIIAGIGTPISKDAFLANTTPFTGRFPGTPRRITRILRGTGRIAESGALLTVMSGGNPEIGFGIAIGKSIVTSIVAHHYRHLAKEVQ